MRGGCRHRSRSVAGQYRLRYLRHVIREHHDNGIAPFAGDEQLTAISVKAQVIRPDSERQIRDDPRACIHHAQLTTSRIGNDEALSVGAKTRRPQSRRSP